MDASDFKRIGSELGFRPDVIEKDYVLTWLIAAVYNSPLKAYFVFKGGTALRKVYFPEWRLSEDLDFTLVAPPEPRQIRKDLETALKWMKEKSGISSKIKEFRPTNNAIHASVQFEGKLGKNTISFDISRIEKMAQSPTSKKTPAEYDVPQVNVVVYSPDELLAEKIRSILQRGKARDYYDVWRLLKNGVYDHAAVRKLLLKKCELVGFTFDPSKAFDPERLQGAKTHWERSLGRLTTDLPDFSTVIQELKRSLDRVLNAR